MVPNILFISSAKHLHSPEEQLTSLAGSFGYVAPEVLNKTGHGKAVDIWSTGYEYMVSYQQRRTDSSQFRVQDHNICAAVRLFTLQIGRRETVDQGDDRGED